MDKCRNFAENLEAVRKIKNVSMAEFSEELNIPKSTLRDVLKDGNASLHTALHIAGQLDIPLSALTGEAIPAKELDPLRTLLTCFQWFASLDGERQAAVAAHFRAFLEALRM